MKPFIKKISRALLLVPIFALAFTALPVTSVYADTTTQVKEGVNRIGGTDNTTNLTDLVGIIINVILFIAGAVAVVMIIIGGIKYIISNGNDTMVTSAKHTIMYAVIGLIIVLLAFAIVNFIIDGIKPQPSEEDTKSTSFLLVDRLV